MQLQNSGCPKVSRFNGCPLPSLPLYGLNASHWSAHLAGGSRGPWTRLVVQGGHYATKNSQAADSSVKLGEEESQLPDG